MEVVFFDSEIREFVDSLEEPAQRKVLKTFKMLKRLGFNLSMPFSKKVDNKLYELRTLGRPKVRIFYTYHNNEWVMLYGFIKKTMRIPLRELYIAKKRLSMLA